MFELTIDTGNAAFDPEPGREIARILRELADRTEIDPGYLMACGYGHVSVRDVNGNTCGRFFYDDEPEG